MELSDEELISTQKEFSGDLRFELKHTNKAFKIISFRPEDALGSTFPGCTIEILLRAPQEIDDCKYTFTIFRVRERTKHRIYQLEIVPKDKRSHNGPPKVYGPHEHRPDGVFQVEKKIDWDDYAGWLLEFCDRVNLTVLSEFPAPFGCKDEM